MKQKFKTRKEHDNVYVTAKRVVSLMLALLLLFSLSPAVFATNGEPTEGTQPAEPDLAVDTPPTTIGESAQTETIALEADPPLETTDTPTEDLTEEAAITTASDEGIMLASSTTGNLMFFNLSRQACLSVAPIPTA